MTRGLAAVLAVDVADYSRLMGADSKGTLAALRRLRTELFRPMVAGHHGTIVKNMGDGWIVTFSSAVDAVTCAMRLQDSMVLEGEIQLRTGVHLGDIVHEDEDVFGEGVNVAARLEALCKPGGVTISDAVYGVIDGTLRPAFDDAGEQTLKNIKRPVRVWTRGGITGAKMLKDRSGMEGFPRLVIRPVTTSSDTVEVRELADALTHDLATYLGSTRWLQSRVSTAEMAVGFELSANLRASGSRLRLQTRLKAPGSAEIWSAKHDGSLQDAFDWQDELASAIATQLVSKTLDFVLDEIKKKPESERSWEDFTILALQPSGADQEGLRDALQYVVQALEKRPDSSYPYELALTFWTSATSIGYLEVSEYYREATGEWLSRAREFGGMASSSRANLAFFNFVNTGDIVQARIEVEAFLRDLPFDLEALVFAGFLFNYIGEPEKALECFQKFDLFASHVALAVPVRNGMAGALIMLGRFEEALTHLERAIRLNPSYAAPYRWKACALVNLGRTEEAKAELAKHEKILPGVTIASLASNSYTGEVPAHRVFREGLRAAGMPEE
ncbi:MAG: tetratricopeptide repeat protein [Sulfitobacter sp.]|nr:tetratricopeptide repeat protein [Sulfitobacter sp.]